METRIRSDKTDQWKRYTVKKVGIGATSYFTVNGGTAIPAENDQSQDIALEAFPTFTMFEEVLVKTALVFSAVTTAIADLVISAAGTIVDLNDFNLKTAVSDTQLYRAAATNISMAAQTLSVRVTVTVETMRDIADGCAFDLYIKTSRLQGS